jgi:hypothetical protein
LLFIELTNVPGPASLITNVELSDKRNTVIGIAVYIGVLILNYLGKKLFEFKLLLHLTHNYFVDIPDSAFCTGMYEFSNSNSFILDQILASINTDLKLHLVLY